MGWGTLAKTVEYSQRLAEERCQITWLVHPSANGCLGGADWPSEVRGVGPAPGGMARTNASNQLIHLFPRRVGGACHKTLAWFQHNFVCRSTQSELWNLTDIIVGIALAPTQTSSKSDIMLHWNEWKTATPQNKAQTRGTNQRKRSGKMQMQ